MIASHALDCEACRPFIGAARIRKAIGHAALTFAIAALVTGSILLWTRRPAEDRLARLVEVASRSGRPIEARLSGGFPWAPLRAMSRGEESSSTRLRLKATTSEIIDASSNDATLRGRHATALAYVMGGDTKSASSVLATISGPAADAAIWNDIAALQYDEAQHGDDPAKLVSALGAVDNSLRLDAKFAEARFNRALIIERLGLREQAREAWDAYLVVDSSSEWANEARNHLRNLQPPPLFKDVLERAYRDDASATAIAREYRLDARLWGETEVLGRWALAHQEGKHDEAARHLRVARTFGTELARNRGDAMLQSLVSAIDRASDEARTHLVAGHLALREGQRLYRSNQPARAEKILLEAAEHFTRGGSRGALLARYFAANTAYSLGRIDESGEKLRSLLDAPKELVAFRAQVLWQIGLVHMARTRWGDSINALTESARTFDQLEEQRYAANVREILGNAYARIGNRPEAWNQRMLALPEIGRTSGSRLLTMVTALGQSAAIQGDWSAATSLLNLAVDVTRRIDDPFIETSTLLMRARIHIRRDDHESAWRDLRQARNDIAAITDPGYHALLSANATHVEARLTANPSHRVRLLTDAIEFHRTHGRRVFLPELLLERGRAHRQLRDDGTAAADFEGGAAELESRRETLAANEDRWGIFDETEELFHEAIALSLDRQEVARAFEYAERARARSLLDALGVKWPRLDPAAIPAGTLIVEYALQPGGVVIFTADRDGVRATTSRIAPATLLADATTFRDAAILSDRKRLRESGARLHRTLMQPVETELIGKQNVIIVPDPKFADIPFAALVDETGRFFLERHVVAVSPSAASFARFASAPPTPSDPQVLIVIGDEELGRMAALEREARAISRLYGRVARLPRELATPEEFARRAASADVIHFGGHSVDSSQGTRAGYLSLKPGADGDGRLDVRDIAALRLRRTSVVVLAACGTAAGEVRSTEGTISVARAFLAAGAPSVIATLWPIEDEQAAEFFPAVHRHLARGLRPAEAVRAVQLEWLQRADEPTALWTAVQVIGN